MILAHLGGMGHTIVFMCSFAAAIIVGLYLFAYASHCFLVTVEQTSTGNDEVKWPDEPYIDWLWRAVTLAWLLLVWLAPVGIVFKITYRNIYSENFGLAFIIGGTALWLFLPIAVLSALYANSAWVFFHPRIPLEMLRVAVSTFVFYLVSAILFAIGFALWYFAFRGKVILLPFASCYGAVALLIYARLLGRLAWIIMAKHGKRRRKKPRKYADQDSALPPLPPPVSSSNEPSDLPEVPEKVRKSGYEMSDDDAELEASSQVPATDIMERMQRRFAGAENRVARKGPPRSLWRGVFGYPFYEASVGATMWLAFAGMFFGMLLRIMFFGV